MSAFASVAMAPRDPILGLNEQFASDPNPGKVNLGVGVYCDSAGKLPVLACVQAAEKQLLGTVRPRGYLPIDGIAAYDTAVQQLVFGQDSATLAQGCIATAQTLGGTGGLRVGADFLRLLAPGATVYISDPSWENHRALFIQAGYTVQTYPYYDAQARGVNLQGMLACIHSAPKGSIFVLHACCHNPTGYDLSPEAWKAVATAIKTGEHFAFMDMAYQGFGHGIAQDSAAVLTMVAAGVPLLVATSFSKSFSLYGERVGAISVVCESKDETARVLSQLKIMIRTSYSNPPTHGAQVVATVLGTPTLSKQWEEELAGMRQRIKSMREQFVTRLKTAGVKQDMGFVTRQVGMFSYSGLSAEQMQRLRSQYGIYGTDSGRMCVAALNENNIGYVCDAIAQILKE